MPHRYASKSTGGKCDNPLPRSEMDRQQPPLNSAFDEIEDDVDNTPPICRRTSARTWLGEQRFQKGPLSVGYISVVPGGFHRLSELRLNGQRFWKPAKSRSVFDLFLTIAIFFRQALSRLPASKIISRGPTCSHARPALPRRSTPGYKSPTHPTRRHNSAPASPAFSRYPR